MVDLIERLLNPGWRLLATTQKLRQLPLPLDMPMVFRTLMQDPARQLSEMLAPLSEWPTAIDASEEQAEQIPQLPPFKTARSRLSFENRRIDSLAGQTAHRQTDYQPGMAGFTITEKDAGKKAARPAVISPEPYRARTISLPALAAMPSPTPDLTRSITLLNLPPAEAAKKLSEAAPAGVEEMKMPSYRPVNLTKTTPKARDFNKPKREPSRSPNWPKSAGADLEHRARQFAMTKPETARAPALERSRVLAEDRVAQTGHSQAMAKQDTWESPGVSVNDLGMRSPQPDAKVVASRSLPFAGLPFTGPRFDGVRMAQGAPQIAALLQANLAAHKPLQTSFSPAGEENQESSSRSIMKSNEHLAGQQIAPLPPALGPQLDMEQLVEKLAEQLELELIRMYGTSGR